MIFFLMKVSKSPGKDNELFLQFLGDNSHYLVTITVMILNEWGELGVCKSANPCLFFTKSVDPSIFLIKSETTTTFGNRSVNVQK